MTNREVEARPSAPLAIPHWAQALAHLLDSAVVIPGTNIRVGLDAILGFFAPGVGDAAAAVVTAGTLWVGFRHGVPKVILLRMVFNLLLDAVLGAIPIVGDWFDVLHRAANKNLELLRRYGVDGYRPGFGDYAVATFVFACLAAILITPLLLGFALFRGLGRWLSG